MKIKTAEVIIPFLRQYWILLLLVLVKFILQFILVNPIYELHRDEFLHLDQAGHLSWGYISVPPLTALFSKIIFLLGGSEFWIRFFPALFGAGTIIFTWLIIESIGGRMFSKIVVCLGLLFSVFVRLNILFQPNSFDYLVWTIIFYLIIKYILSEKSRLLWYLSAAIAIGLYNKYTIVFLIFGLACGLLLTRQRRLFLKPAVWIAGLLAIVLMLPNILWQYNHNFPVIDHMRVLKENQLDNNSPAGFIFGQIRIFNGSLPLILVGLFTLLTYKPFRPFRFVSYTFITIMLVFTFLKAKDYYSLGLFPVMLAFGGVYLEGALKGRLRTAIMFSVVLFNLVIFAFAYQFVMPVLSPAQIIEKKELFEKMGMLRWEDGKNHHLPQDFADMTGWKEMADKALAAYKTIPADELQSTLVFCDNYGQTGALNYYNRGKMKEAYSFNTDYIFWLPRMDHIKNFILVGDKPDYEIERLFREYELSGIVENVYSRERNTGIYIFRESDPSFTATFYRIAEERKHNLDIF